MVSFEEKEMIHINLLMSYLNYYLKTMKKKVMHLKVVISYLMVLI